MIKESLYLTQERWDGFISKLGKEVYRIYYGPCGVTTERVIVTEVSWHPDLADRFQVTYSKP